MGQMRKDVDKKKRRCRVIISAQVLRYNIVRVLSLAFTRTISKNSFCDAFIDCGLPPQSSTASSATHADCSGAG